MRLPFSTFLAERLLIDRSVALAILLRGWQLAAGVFSLWVIGRFFSPEVQGYFYAFASLLSIQMFFDLGLTGVLTYVASHEWAAASNEAHPESLKAQRRLAELVERSWQWYGLCSVLFCATAMGVGFWFFSAEADGVSWQLPWLGAVALTSASLWLYPAFGILEGCNFIATLNGFRLVQAILGNLVVWTVIILGGGLWSVVASACVRLAVELWLIRLRFSTFWSQLRSVRDRTLPAALSWKDELLPLQWRIAVQSIAGWIALQGYTPIIFKYHGPVLGGQMGMTWTALTTIQMTAVAWIQTRIPEMGRLISERRLDESRSLLRRLIIASVGVYVAAAACFLLLILILQEFWPALAARVLDPGTVLLFSIGLGLNLVVYGLHFYVRAHKIDPFLGIGTTTALLLGGLAWWLGATVGPRGVALAHIGVMGIFALPAAVVIYRQTADPSSESIP
jgi:hypothetical protein